MTLGAFLSSSTAGPIAAFMGRKPSIWSASLLCCISNVIMMVTTNINAIYIGRLLLGLANGLFMTFSQLYIQVILAAYAARGWKSQLTAYLPRNLSRHDTEV